MTELNNEALRQPVEPAQDGEQDIITVEEARSFRQLFKKCLRSYRAKDPSVTDAQWLRQLFREELPEMSYEKAERDAKSIVEAIQRYDENLTSVNEAAQRGVSKERWLADKLQEASVGIAVNEHGAMLDSIDKSLRAQNELLDKRLSVKVDGNIKRISMNPNLDGVIAENMVASTAQLSGDLNGGKVQVEVLESYNANSVDVRVRNLTSGKYQNYQLKFGKDAKSTIALIERGNYNNQRIIVPKEQLEEVQAHFRAKGSDKTITDHIDTYGVKGKSFTKEEMKSIQKAAQEDGIMPSMDYNHYQTKELAMAVGKNVGVMALQSAAVSAGLDVTAKVVKGENVDPDELVEIAIRTGADTALKTVTAGTLQIAIRKGIISILPKATPAGVIANIACVGIENIKTLAKIASGEMTMIKGMDQIGRTTFSMAGGLIGASKGAALGAAATAVIPVVGPVLGLATGLIGGTVGYFAGSKVGDAIYGAGKKVAETAKKVGKAAWNGIKNAGRSIVRGASKTARVVASFFGL